MNTAPLPAAGTVRRPGLGLGAFRGLALMAAAASFGVTYVFGHLGLFAFDQSMIFDGAWRIYSGQAPYKDFLMAFGPLSFALQAIFFKLCGVTWTAMVISAATLAAIATLSVIRTMVLIFGDEHRGLALVTGALVGLAFQSVFGTLWIEQTAFFCAILGMQMVAEALHRQPGKAWLFCGAAGVLAALALLSKQNAGALTIALLGAGIVAISPPKPAAILKFLTAFGAGLAVVGGLFAVWLFKHSDAHLFFHYAISNPSHMGGSRLSHLRLFFPPTLFSCIVGSTPWCNAVAFGAVSLALFEGWTQPAVGARIRQSAALRLAIVFTLAVPVVQAVFQTSTLNEVQNVLFFSGLTLGLGVGLFHLLHPASPYQRLVQLVGLLLALALPVEFLRAGYQRTVQDSFEPAHQVGRSVNIPALSRLRWLEQTYAGPKSAQTPIAVEDVEGVYNDLVKRGQRFFVIGDSTYLYGITGTLAPTPLLYVQSNHYFTPKDVPDLDAWLLKNLQADNIQVVVREKALFAGTSVTFPKTEKWVADNFSTAAKYGEFEVLTRTGR